MRRPSLAVLAVSAVLLVALLAATIAPASAAGDATAAGAAVPRPLLQDVQGGRCLQPHEQHRLRRTLNAMNEEQRAQLRAESDAYNKAFAARKPLPLRAPGAGPDWAQVGPFVQAFMKCRGVSGLSLAVVQGGKMVWSSGFGVQSTRGEPVDTDTIFGIGSCSKAFTSSLGAILEQDGIFSFDEPVTSYLPDYRLMDKNQEAMLTATDLLTHRTGFASHDTALFLDQMDSRRDRVYAAQYLLKQCSLRTCMIYNNWMVASAGYLFGELAQEGPDGTWEDLVEARIFKPLEMTRTCANFSQCVNKPNRATPMTFDLDTQKWRDMPYELNYLIDQAAPCGAIASTANDMAKWALTHLGHSQHVLTNASLNKLHSPQTTWPDSHSVPSWLYNRAEGVAYAYNWWVGQFDSPGLGTQGVKAVWHQGDVWGFKGLVYLLPELDVGMVLLTNSDSADQLPGQQWWRQMLGWYLMDVANQNPKPTFANIDDACGFPCNWFPSLCPKSAAKAQPAAAAAAAPVEAAAEDVEAEMVEAVDEIKPVAVAAAPVQAGCAAVLSDYLGSFSNPAYGRTTVQYVDKSQQQLLLVFGNFALAPTNATLTYATYGGTDNFVWNINGTDDAQTLTNTRITFLRNTGADDLVGYGQPGQVVAYYMDTTDDSDATVRVLFVRDDLSEKKELTDGEELETEEAEEESEEQSAANDVAAIAAQRKPRMSHARFNRLAAALSAQHAPGAVRGVAAGNKARRLRSFAPKPVAAEVSASVGSASSASSSSSSLSSTGSIVAICVSIVVGALLAAALFAQLSARSTQAALDKLVQAQQQQQLQASGDYRLLQRT